MSVTALLWALFMVSAADANAPLRGPITIHAQTDLVAALDCAAGGYRYMLRLGPQDVLCLRTNVTVAKRAVNVRKYLKAVRPESAQ